MTSTRSEATSRRNLATIARVGPDLLVGDFRISLAASARLAGVPHIAVANAYWSPYGRQTFRFPEYDYPLAGVVGARLAWALFGLLRPVGFAAHTRPLNAVLREHRLPGIGWDIRTMYTFGDYTAYADIPDLAPIEDLPSTHHYIGAVLWSPVVSEPSWWDALPDDRAIVYVTPGSSGEEDFLGVALDALSALPITVIAATAGRVKLDRVPANAHVADFLPGIEAAGRASLVICNGGSPSVYQALAAGIPVLGLVSNNMDQHLNMEAVRLAGAGEAMRARGLTVSRVRPMVEKMLGTTRYHEHARRLAASHRRYDAAKRFGAMVATVGGE